MRTETAVSSGPLHGLLRAWGLIAIAAVGLAGCNDQSASVSSLPSSAPVNNGQSIFQTGKDSRGVQITARRTPLFRSCAACHRIDGSGGMRLAGGVTSADLRHASLVVRQKHPYTIVTLERAISNGIDNEGKPLSPVMPRWKLSKQDLHDVAAYVLTLR